MKKLIALVLLFLLVFTLCPSADAQWDGAQIQQLTDDDLENRLLGLYIDAQDKLHLFYSQGIRDTVTGYVYDHRIFYKTKDKGANWGQPQEIQTSEPIFGMNRHAGLWMDTRTGIVHLIYSSLAGDIYDDTLYYTNSTVPGWEFTKIDSLPGEQSSALYYSHHMDFDTLGNVHLVWHLDYDSASHHWFRAVYVNNSTGQWVKRFVSPPVCVGYGRSGRPFFCVQNDGSAHIIYGPYIWNDSLNSDNWTSENVPIPDIPLHVYRVYELLADASNRIHLFTAGCNSWECDTTYQFYYHRPAKAEFWSDAEIVQVFPPDSGIMKEYFVDGLDNVHMSITTPGGAKVFYSNNSNDDWLEPELLLTDSYAGQRATFEFVIDSEGIGHGVFIDYKYYGPLPEDDSTEVYYYSNTVTSVEDTSLHNQSLTFHLHQNYPNPFNRNTVIRYSLGLARPQQTIIRIYNILGKEVRELINTIQPPGQYGVIWDGRDNMGKEVASGIYFCILNAGERREGKKMLVIK
jgi:hypothetical protein